MNGFREAWRMLVRARKNAFRRYPGTPDAVCDAIIRDAYDRERGYFRTSTGHFGEFYVRDFAWCCDALLRLGYRDEVDRTVEYALATFLKAGRVSTLITPDGTPYDFPCPGPDALALFLLTLERTGNEDLIGQYEEFFSRCLADFSRRFVEDGLPRRGRFTSMRDHARRDRSCYDMVMLALVARIAERHGLAFPLRAKDARQRLIKEYWNGAYFSSDLQRQDIVAGDANTIPFWTGVITDRRMEASALRAIRTAGLDTPFPLRYVSTADKGRERVRWHVASWFAPGYETDSIWAHLGMLHCGLLLKHDRKRALGFLATYGELIRAHGTFLEVYARDGRPYRTPFYLADEGMLWCAMWLDLTRRS